MSKGRKLLFISCFLIIDVLLLGSLFFIREATFKSILRNEVTALSELDFTKDRFNSKVRSKGKYGKVEGLVKKYLDDYAVEVQSVIDITNESKLNNILSSTSIKEEGPSFVNSFDYLMITQEEFNYCVDLLIDRTEKSEFDKYINVYLTNENDIKIYTEAVHDSNIFEELESTRNMLEMRRLSINNYFDSIRNVLVFLSNNSGNYVVEDDRVKFFTEELQIEYDELYNKTKRIYQ